MNNDIKMSFNDLNDIIKSIKQVQMRSVGETSKVTPKDVKPVDSKGSEDDKRKSQINKANKVYHDATTQATVEATATTTAVKAVTTGATMVRTSGITTGATKVKPVTHTNIMSGVTVGVGRSGSEHEVDKSNKNSNDKRYINKHSNKQNNKQQKNNQSSNVIDIRERIKRDFRDNKFDDSWSDTDDINSSINSDISNNTYQNWKNATEVYIKPRQSKLLQQQIPQQSYVEQVKEHVEKQVEPKPKIQIETEPDTVITQQTEVKQQAEVKSHKEQAEVTEKNVSKIKQTEMKQPEEEMDVTQPKVQQPKKDEQSEITKQSLPQIKQHHNHEYQEHKYQGELKDMSSDELLNILTNKSKIHEITISKRKQSDNTSELTQPTDHKVKSVISVVEEKEELDSTDKIADKIAEVDRSTEVAKTDEVIKTAIEDKAINTDEIAKAEVVTKADKIIIVDEKVLDEVVPEDTSKADKTVSDKIVSDDLISDNVNKLDETAPNKVVQEISKDKTDNSSNVESNTNTELADESDDIVAEKVHKSHRPRTIIKNVSEQNGESKQDDESKQDNEPAQEPEITFGNKSIIKLEPKQEFGTPSKPIAYTDNKEKRLASSEFISEMRKRTIENVGPTVRLTPRPDTETRSRTGSRRTTNTAIKVVSKQEPAKKPKSDRKLQVINVSRDKNERNAYRRFEPIKVDEVQPGSSDDDVYTDIIQASAHSSSIGLDIDQDREKVQTRTFHANVNEIKNLSYIPPIDMPKGFKCTQISKTDTTGLGYFVTITLDYEKLRGREMLVVDMRRYLNYTFDKDMKLRFYLGDNINSKDNVNSFYSFVDNLHVVSYGLPAILKQLCSIGIDLFQIEDRCYFDVADIAKKLRTVTTVLHKFTIDELCYIYKIETGRYKTQTEIISEIYIALIKDIFFM